jgi:Ca-activated chloride channel homolog
MRSFFSAVTLGFILFILTAPAFGQKDDDVIKVDSTIVLVNASVLDASGKTVSGLTQKQFTALEDGVVQSITSFAAESTPFAAVILVDTSGSMEERVSMARAAAINFLAGLRAYDNAAIYNFDSKIKQVQDFSNSRDITESVFDLKADGMTVLNDAIYKAAALLSNRSEKRRAIVVLSDGADTLSKHSQNAALNAAIAANATIYTIDMSSPEDHSHDKIQGQAALKTFAQRSGGTFVAAPGGAAMRAAFREIVEELGNQYTITYEPTNTRADGKFRSIEIRVARPGLSIRTRKGYNAPRSK